MSPSGPGNVPRHVAIIMDGNGRWARERNLPRAAGHRAGMQAIRRAVRLAVDAGVEMLTLYAFSTENWRRPRPELRTLFGLILEFLRREIDELDREGVRVQAIGRWSELPDPQRHEIARAVARTANNQRLVLTVALNYGGRSELVDAARALARDVAAGCLRAEDIDEQALASRLYTFPLPDPDLLIRTGGEMRLSNFLLWQLAYTEIWVTADYWPSFDREHFRSALDAYAQRERRFGGLGSSSDPPAADEPAAAGFASEEA